MAKTKLYRDILIKLHELEKIKSCVPNEKMPDLTSSIFILKAFLAEEEFVEESLDEIFESEYHYLTKYGFLWDYSKSLAKHTNDDILNIPYPNTNFNKSEIIALVHDFFKNATSPRIYELYLQLSKRNPYFTSFKNPEFHADSIFIPFDSSFYTRINLRNEFSDIATIAHEYGHGIEFLLNYGNNRFNALAPFLEIVATFFELLCLEYYSADKTLYKKAISANFVFFDTTVENAHLLTKEMHLLESPPEEVNEEVEDILLSRTSLDFPYIIAYTFAIELFAIYQKDADYAFYILEKLISIDTNLPPEEYLKAINNLGLNPDTNTTNYENHLKRELTRL